MYAKPSSVLLKLAYEWMKVSYLGKGKKNKKIASTIWSKANKYIRCWLCSTTAT